MSNDNVTLPPEAQEATQSALALVAQSIVAITTPEQYVDAGGFLTRVKATWSKLEDLRKFLKKPHMDKAAAVDVWFRPALNQLAEAEKECKAAMLTYDRKVKEAAAAEQRRIQAEKDAEERRLREQAEAAREAGKPIAAKLAEQQAAAVAAAPTPVVTAPVVRVAGVGTRKVWKHQVTDFSKLPDEFKLPNDTKLGQLARNMQDKAAVAGVRFYFEEIISGRAG